MHHHTGLAYEGTEEFLAGAVPFIAEGLSDDRAVIAITAPQKADALRDALGGAGSAVAFSSTDQWYMSQARAFSRFVEHARASREAGRKGLCILTDPNVAHFDAERLSRWLYVENAVSDVLGTASMSVMCTYDLRTAGLTRAQIEVSHPHMASGDRIQPSGHFIEPVRFNESCYAVARSSAPSDAPAMAFDGSTLAQLRAFVERTALELALSSSQALDLTIAASEAAANAVEHGGGDGIARLWRNGPEVLCEIENALGRVGNESAGFITPDWASERGRGIWLMRQLCEWVDLRAAQNGTNVRLHMRDL